jgi:hypothetical protein
MYVVRIHPALSPGLATNEKTPTISDHPRQTKVVERLHPSFKGNHLPVLIAVKGKDELFPDRVIHEASQLLLFSRSRGKTKDIMMVMLQFVTLCAALIKTHLLSTTSKTCVTFKRVNINLHSDTTVGVSADKID